MPACRLTAPPVPYPGDCEYDAGASVAAGARDSEQAGRQSGVQAEEEGPEGQQQVRSRHVHAQSQRKEDRTDESTRRDRNAPSESWTTAGPARVRGVKTGFREITSALPRALRARADPARSTRRSYAELTEIPSRGRVRTRGLEISGLLYASSVGVRMVRLQVLNVVLGRVVEMSGMGDDVDVFRMFRFRCVGCGSYAFQGVFDLKPR